MVGFRCMMVALAPLLLVIQAVAEESPRREVTPHPHSSALTLKDDESFDDAVASHERLFVLFTSPPCGLCKQLAPVLDAVIEKATTEGLTTVIAEAATSDKWGTRFELPGYPAIHYYVGGELVKSYLGTRDVFKAEDTWLAWIKKREKAVEDILEMQENAHMRGYQKGQVPIMATIKKNSVRAKVFREAVKALANYDSTHFIFAEKPLAKGTDPKADAALALGGEQVDESERYGLVHYEGKWTTKAIVDWALRNAYAAVGPFLTDRQYDHFALEELGLKASVVALLDKDSIRRKMERKKRENPDLEREFPDVSVGDDVRSVLLTAADDYPQWRFTMDEFDSLTEKQLERLGAVPGTVDPLIIVTMADNTKFLLEGEDNIRDADIVAQFFKHISSGALRPAYKSEPVPENEFDADGSRILVGTNFADYALDPTKDVLVLFTTHAAICPKCEKAITAWSALAKRGKKLGWENSGVVLARIDSQTNDCEENEKEAPSVILYPAVKKDLKMKKRRKYKGEIETVAMAEFLRENSVNGNALESSSLYEEL